MKKWLAAALNALVLGSTAAWAEPGSFQPSEEQVDTVAPAAPVVSADLERAVVTPTPTITGTAEPGSTITVLIDGQEVGITQADASGNWSYTPTKALVDGLHEVKARVTDTAGNTSTESEGRTFTVVVQGGEDLSLRGDGISGGCAATGGDPSLVLMGLGLFVALARPRRR